jgi:toxin YoeB
MKITFDENAWDDYLFWQKNNRKILTKINNLLKDIERSPFAGIGQPEPLKYELQGLWSRRIDLEHRLVYQVVNDEIQIASCRFHYEAA